MSKKLEDLVLIAAVVLGLLIALYLSYASAVRGEHYPPTLIATFLAIGVAALIYRFMGGLVGTEFKVGLLTLGGSAAFFVGIIWFVGDRLQKEIGLYDSSGPYLGQITALQRQNNQQQRLNAQLQAELQRARSGHGGSCAAAQCTIANVRKLQPNDPFVQGIKRLVDSQDPPFTPTLKEMPVRIAVVAGLGSNPAFNICGDTLDKLNEGVDAPDPNVQFSRSLDDGSTATINARRAGRIGEDVCASDQRGFDVQINCPVVLKLFPDKIKNCAEGSTLRGQKVSIGSLAD
jgi:hypothetical protein